MSKQDNNDISIEDIGTLKLTYSNTMSFSYVSGEQAKLGVVAYKVPTHPGYVAMLAEGSVALTAVRLREDKTPLGSATALMTPQEARMLSLHLWSAANAVDELKPPHRSSERH